MSQDTIFRLRKALGYPDSYPTVSLAILVTEICEDNAEKTRLLQRVDAYLDKITKLSKQGKQVDVTTQNQKT